jgi:hypothetical protein
MEKMNARDGKGCLDALGKSSKPELPAEMSLREAQLAIIASQCMMLAGDCSGGKQLYKAAMRKTSPLNFSEGMLDHTSDQVGSMYCEGTMNTRDALLRANFRLTSGASGTIDTNSATCEQSYKTVKDFLPLVKAVDDEDPVASVGPGLVYIAPNCFARAGDCRAARAAYETEMGPRFTGITDLALRKKTLEEGFGGVVPRCVPKR